MEVALRSLGTVNRRDRVRRFVEEVCSPMEDPSDPAPVDSTNLYGLERSAILESRREKRCAHSLSMAARACEPLQPAVSLFASRLPQRRRATDENARRAERTLGRAAHLRPGRITLLPHSLQRSEQSFEQNMDYLTQRSCKRLDKDANISAPRSLDSWEFQEHSVHSNQKHEDGIEAQDSASNVKQEAVDGLKASIPLTKSKLFGDFYLRNPASLSNGWLAERHHREAIAEMNLDRPTLKPTKLIGVTSLLGLCPLARKKAAKRCSSGRR